MRQVPPYSLFPGHIGDARDSRRLLDAEIAAIIDLAINEQPLSPPRELIYCRFPLNDGDENDPSVIRCAVQTIASLIRTNTRTLVYCSAGLSRTPVIAAAAVALYANIFADEALKRIAESGTHDVSPALWKSVCAALESLTADRKPPT